MGKLSQFRLKIQDNLNVEKDIKEKKKQSISNINKKVKNNNIKKNRSITKGNFKEFSLKIILNKSNKLSSICRQRPKTTQLLNPRIRQSLSGKLKAFGNSFVMGDGSGSPKSLFRLYNSQRILRNFDISIEDRPSLGERQGRKRYEPVLLYVQQNYVELNYLKLKP